ncbi:MAG: helix-hairpin-helix domain-containing protein [Porphyromonas sp.]|nr:helix-hairpin-helix domain-containing protein [Porphyromonas sp.]
MIHRRWLLALLLLLWWALGMVAQSEGTEAVEQLLERVEDEEGRALLQERLEALLLSPIDLNRATIEELASLPLVDDFFLRNIIVERARRGGFSSIYQLKEVQGAPTDLSLLEPFITIVEEDEVDERRSFDLFLGGENNLGEWRDRGSKVRMEGHLNKHLAWYLVGEQDRGERSLPLREGGMDFLGGTVEYSRLTETGSLQLILGDYRVMSGLGLVMGQSASYYSGIEVRGSAPAMTQRVLRPHASFREYDYLRGAAVRWGRGALSLSVYGGFEPLDARIERSAIRTLYATGRHITEYEQRYRRTARRELLGSYLELNRERLHVGLTTIWYLHKTRDGQPLLPPLRYPQERRLSASSLDFYLLSRWSKLFGEVTLDAKERMAMIVGYSYRRDYLGTITLSASYAGQERMTPYGTYYGYASSGRDELAVQLAWKGELGYLWTGQLFYSAFTPVSERAMGRVVSAQFLYYGDERQMQSRLRWVKLPDRPARCSGRMALQQQFGGEVKLRSVVNLTKHAESALGWAVALRLQFGDERSLRAEIGAQYFQLPSGLSVRSDNVYMPYYSYAPGLYGEGFRLVGALRYPVTDQLRVDARASLTRYKVAPKTPLPPLLNITLRYRLVRN